MINQCGKYLGEGYRRIVYEHKNNPNLVIKYLKSHKDRHNKTEYENWIKLKDTEKGKWLVPCLSLSVDGRYLLQRRVKVLDKVPEDVPDWIKALPDYSLGGNKSKHWGMFNGRTVLIDYGNQIL